MSAQELLGEVRDAAVESAAGLTRQLLAFFAQTGSSSRVWSTLKS